MPVVSQCPLKHSGSGKTHVVRSGVELLAGMHSYGAKQQGASPANVDFSRAMVDAFCPQWPELLGADGGVWDLRTELSFAEYERTVRAMHGRQGVRGRWHAAGLPPHVIARAALRVLATAHLVCRGGHLPRGLGHRDGLLIAKKSGSPMRIQDQRDIWLQCVGPKTLMKMVVANVYEPLRARVLPCAAGAIAGRGTGELILRMGLCTSRSHRGRADDDGALRRHAPRQRLRRGGLSRTNSAGHARRGAMRTD